MLASLNIDLDGLECYHAIHGLAPPRFGQPIHEVALPRFLELLDELRAAGTLFVITRDLDGAGARRVLGQAVQAGHELASHTHTHPYDFGRRGRDQVGAELDRAAERLEAVFGRRPVGFRAPGYHVREAVLDSLEARGYRYDSSVFPCPPYYAAKLAVMAGMRLRGRRSGSSLTDPRALLAPLQPYRPRPGAFHRPGGANSRPLWEIPLCVVPRLRLPVIGTTLAVFGDRRFRQVYPWLRRAQPYLNLEFHGIDFLGPGDEGVTDALLDRQPDLRVPFGEKLRIYREVLSRVGADYGFVTLADMTDQLERPSAGSPDRAGSTFRGSY